MFVYKGPRARTLQDCAGMVADADRVGGVSRAPVATDLHEVLRGDESGAHGLIACR